MNAKRYSLMLAVAGAVLSTGAGAYGLNDIPEKFLQSFGPPSGVVSQKTVPTDETGMWTNLAATHGVGVRNAGSGSGTKAKAANCIHPKGPVGETSIWTTLAETRGVGRTPEQARAVLMAEAPCPIGGAPAM